MKAYRILNARVAGVLQRFGINPTQWFILGLIKQDKSIRAADIADMLRVEPPLITVMSGELRSKGWIDKNLNPKDKRSHTFVLTDSGQQMVKDVEARLRKDLAILLDGVSKAEMNAYQRVLEIIVKNGSKSKN